MRPVPFRFALLHGGDGVVVAWELLPFGGIMANHSTVYSLNAEAALPAEHSADAQRRESVRLRYRFGSLPVGSVRLEALVHEHRLGHAVSDTALAADALRRGGAEVRLLQSRPVNEDPPAIEFRDGLLRYTPEVYWRHYVDLRRSFAEYEGTAVSRKSRSTIGRKMRRFAAESGGTIDWREFRAVGEMDELYALARRVSRRTYQEHLYGAGVPERQHFAETLRQKAARDEVRGFVLFLRGRPISYLLCLAEGEVIRAQYFGYDPESKCWSPGTVLQYLALRCLFDEQRFAVFDFTKGDGQHKAVFGSHAVRCADTYEFSLRPKALLVVATHAGVTAAGRLTGRVLQRIGLLSSARRWIRARATALSQ